MTELNVFEDAASGYIVFENEGRIVKATPQQAMGLMVSLARRFGYQIVQPQQEQETPHTKPTLPVGAKEDIDIIAKNETEEVETEETESEEEGDEEVEELFEETQPVPQKVAVKKPSTPPPPPPPARPLNVAKQVEAKMLAQRSPGRVGKSF